MIFILFLRLQRYIKMRIELDKITTAFIALGKAFTNQSEEINEIQQKAFQANPWFTPEQISFCFQSWANNLTPENLDFWIKKDVKNENKNPKTVALICAGNIPLVGLHDVLCVLISKNKALIKPSSQDEILMKYAAKILIQNYPVLENYITFTNEKLENFDAAIATGSDNSARYFDFYFNKYPHIIRKNRNSVAIVPADISVEEMKNLADDVFIYFGKGCRNVTHLFLEEGMDITKLLDQWQHLEELVNHHKYANNYIYHKAILLMNLSKHLDTNYLLLQENDMIYAPVSTLNYSFYKNEQELLSNIENQKDKIQCIIGKNHIPFGASQLPKLWEYADDVNTMDFLNTL